jgi:hypothetical protein
MDARLRKGHRAGVKPRARRPRSGAILLACLVCWSYANLVRAGDTDPGLVIELDAANYTVTFRDLRDEVVGPVLPVVLGSPSNPTPAGRHRAGRVILSPAWTPGPGAGAAGAVAEAPSLTSPMGVAKIPFALGGAIALHGGGDARLVGQPVSGGCVRAGDGDLLRAIAWLDLRGALGAPSEVAGEIHRDFVRRIYVVVE